MFAQERGGFGEVWRLRFAERFGDQPGGNIDAVEHVADVVQHAGRDLCHARATRRFEQLPVEFPEFRLGALALGDLVTQLAHLIGQFLPRPMECAGLGLDLVEHVIKRVGKTSDLVILEFLRADRVVVSLADQARGFGQFQDRA